MLAKFLGMVQHLYMTSYDTSCKPKRREKTMEKMIQKFNPTLREVTYQKGIIENYIDLSEVGGTWKTTLHEKAFEINDEFITNL